VTAPLSHPALDPARLDRAFELVRRQVADGRARYVGLAVGRADRLVRSETFGPDGVSDTERRFLVASITKPITATAVLQLVEDGRLVLTRPIPTYLPEFRPLPAEPGTLAGEAITAWHILTHTSGLDDGGQELLEVQRPTGRALLERVCCERLQFVPGSRYQYASDSFYLLAELFGRLGELEFEAHLRQRLFQPLGMDATTFDPTDSGPEPFPLAGMFDKYGPLLGEATRYFVSLAMPGGGLWSTPSDLVRFGRAMLGGGSLDGARILGRPFVELMTRKHTGDVMEAGTPPRRPHYGLGWGLPGRGQGSPASERAFGHTGATGSQLIVDPEWDLVVVYLRNEWDADMAQTDEAIQAVYGALD
jgi:CubicO group peptidase (beta-lactamase class C family)